MPPTNQPDPQPPHGATLPSILGEVAARRLVRAATAEAQLVLDLDDDPSLRRAATSQRRAYQAISETDTAWRGLGNLVVVRWPRPGDDAGTARAPEVFTAVRALMARGALAAVVLEPVPAQAVTITWTGMLLAAAAEAGLTTLQDIISVLDSRAGHRPECQERVGGKRAPAR